MLEGTTLSEGRGTTRPLELFGAPDLEARAAHRADACARAALAARLPPAALLVRAHVSQARRASCAQACRSTSKTRAYDHDAFRPWRLQALAFKALAAAAPGLRAVARLPLRVRARPAGDRSHQRQRAAARAGSTIRAPRRPIWMRSRERTKQRGAKSARARSSIDEVLVSGSGLNRS